MIAAMFESLWGMAQLVFVGYMIYLFMETLESWSKPRPPRPSREQLLAEAAIARKKLSRDLDGRIILWILDKLAA